MSIYMYVWMHVCVYIYFNIQLWTISFFIACKIREIYIVSKIGATVNVLEMRVKYWKDPLKWDATPNNTGAQTT